MSQRSVGRHCVVRGGDWSGRSEVRAGTAAVRLGAKGARRTVRNEPGCGFFGVDGQSACSAMLVVAEGEGRLRWFFSDRSWD